MFTLFLQCINSTFSDDYYPYFAENTLFSLNSYFYYPIGSIKKHQILKHQFSKTHECPQQSIYAPKDYVLSGSKRPQTVRIEVLL